MNKLKKWSIALFALCSLCISYLQPLTVYAEEQNYTVTVHCKHGYTIDGNEYIDDYTVTLKSETELVGWINNVSGYNSSKLINISYYDNRPGYLFATYNPPDDVQANAIITYKQYKNDKIILDSSESVVTYSPSLLVYEGKEGITNTLDVSWSGMKLFETRDQATAYFKSGSSEGLIEPPKNEIDKNWCLKNIGYTVRADDSPTSEAGEDATYIKFTWDIDNLQEGDLLEIKTHSYYKKIGGDQVSGFHDYITYSNHVSAYSGEYELSQYDATKAWFDSLENKPLIFKSYDTDTYYLRPWRNGLAGGWAKVSMSRATPTSTPYIEGIEYGDLDPETGEWEPDDDLTEKNGGGQGIDQNGNKIIPGEENIFTGTNVDNIFAKFFDFMKSLPSMFGDLPALLNQTIGFLPAWVIGAICAAILICIILRIVGR